MGEPMKHLVLCMAIGCGHGQSPTDAMPDQDGAILVDGSQGACGTNGVGSVTGAIGGVEISPVMRANQVAIGTEGIAIVLDEVAGQCGVPGETGEHLVLLFCDVGVGLHSIADEQTFACPGSNSAALIEQNGGTDFAEATEGSVTIEIADGECTTGTFTIDLTPDVGSPGTLTGSFAAVVCP